MSDETAFVRLFRAEVQAFQRDALVALYVWANRTSYAADPFLYRRAGVWADDVIASGKADEVLMAWARREEASDTTIRPWTARLREAARRLRLRTGARACGGRRWADRQPNR